MEMAPPMVVAATSDTSTCAGGSESENSSSNTAVSSLTSTSGDGRLCRNTSNYDVVVPNDLVPLQVNHKEEAASKYINHNCLSRIDASMGALKTREAKLGQIVLSIKGIRIKCQQLARDCYRDAILEAITNLELTKTGSDSVKPTETQDLWLSVKHKYCGLGCDDFIKTTGPIFLHPLCVDTTWLDKAQTLLEDHYKFTIAMDEGKSRKSFVHKIGKKLLSDAIKKRYNDLLKKWGVRLFLTKPKDVLINGAYRSLEIGPPQNKKELTTMKVWLISLSAIEEVKQSKPGPISEDLENDMDRIVQRALADGVTVGSLLSAFSKKCKKEARQTDDIDDTSSGKRERPKKVVSAPPSPNSQESFSVATTGRFANSSLGGSSSSSVSTLQSESVISSRTRTSEDSSATQKENNDKNRKVNSAGIDSDDKACLEEIRRNGGLIGNDVSMLSVCKDFLASLVSPKSHMILFTTFFYSTEINKCV